ncbi:MAG: carbamate kinase [Candidatus Aminicenantes bacterium]|nr:carbamate kinase [Candidatus Aminicenantes bacterium]
MKRKKDKTVVVAIGGNFLSDGRSLTAEQMKKASKSAQLIKLLVERGFKVVVVHGNGPQVGLAYLRQLSGEKENIPPLNLALCDALTQAEIGTMLELAIINEINYEMPDFEVLTIVSQVEVGKDDPAFKNPAKPIGPFYTQGEIKELKKKFPGWTFIEDAGRGYRRVVPSPLPVKIFAAASIVHAFEKVDVIIAGGGGGIPVIRREDNTFELVDGVIDKDRTACLIALNIKATHFFLLTGVGHVCINYGQPDEEALFDLKIENARRYLDEGQFPVGSMGPKIEAAVEFVRETRGTAIITNADSVASALDGSAGTRIHL